MKLKQIESILKRNKNVIMYDAGGVQWLSDGAALYPVFGMPKLSEENLLTMWDVPEDKRSKWHFHVASSIGQDIRDTVEGEYIAKRDMSPVCFKGEIVEPLEMEEGVIFISQRYLRPFDDIENGYELYIRHSSGGVPYVVVKEGYVLVGAVMPMMVIDKAFVDELERLLELSKMALANKCCVRDE